MTQTCPSRPFTCWWCGEKFVEHQALRDHLKEKQHKTPTITEAIR
jgi:hypothetical protein